jgi:hypothetical protein
MLVFVSNIRIIVPFTDVDATMLPEKFTDNRDIPELFASITSLELHLHI